MKKKPTPKPAAASPPLSPIVVRTDRGEEEVYVDTVGETAEERAEALQESQHFVQSLFDRGGVARAGEALTPGATHEIATDESGRQRIRARRRSLL